MNTNTRITIQPSRQDISLTVTLAHIAAVLEHTLDSALPAGEALTIELDSIGGVIVTRQDGQRLSYSHPRARARRAMKAEPEQLKLAI